MDNEQDRYRVLIVDDIPANITIIGNYIKQDYVIKVATNGPDALAIMLSDWIPDLVLLDIAMPEMDGIEVCEKIRQEPAIKEVPIIFVTANTDDKVLARTFKAGGNDYIRKPVNKVELVTRIKAIFDQKELVATRKSEEKLTGAMEMAGAVCHELNQPLQAILTCSELLVQLLPEDHQGHEMSETILDQTKSMRTLTKKLNKITNYTTKRYIGKTHIIDIDKSIE
ncbi:MAG: response regulator [Desulfobacteraceae bacterium]|nr:response regulator [Desulfobacteraceae bacterium]